MEIRKSDRFQTWVGLVIELFVFVEPDFNRPSRVVVDDVIGSTGERVRRSASEHVRYVGTRRDQDLTATLP